MKNQFWAVGCWSWLDCEIKGSGPILSIFWGLFFHFFGVKKNIIGSALKSCIIPFLIFFYIIFFWPRKSEKKPTRAKNLSLSTKTLWSVLCLLLLWSHHIHGSTNPWIHLQALFLLLDLIISQVINHVTCYKFKWNILFSLNVVISTNEMNRIYNRSLGL